MKWVLLFVGVVGASQPYYWHYGDQKQADCIAGEVFFRQNGPCDLEICSGRVDQSECRGVMSNICLCKAHLGGGPIRDALDVLRWPFATGCMAETAEDFKTVLHAERQLARQPYRFSLQFGDNRTAWRAPLTDDEYGLIFAEPKYQLPDKLRNLLKAQIGPNDEATAFRHTQFSEKNDSHEATRFDHIHIYVAQNRRGVGIEAVKVRNGYKLVKERDECVPIPWR
ncbi:unnamed protein product, partial [Mesorhabditis spiculigera]